MDERVLPNFLRKMAEKIENKKLDQETLQKCGEFYMACKTPNKILEELSNEELRKYAVCGMWVYQEAERLRLENTLDFTTSVQNRPFGG